MSPAESQGGRDEKSARLHRYTLPGGWTVLAGRTDRDNEWLSLRVARANDWWFHVRGLPGSHVVLQVPAGADPDRATVRAAAAIAAWHCKKRGAKQVAVTAARARYVSKSPGSPPGTVQVRREVMLLVRPALPGGNQIPPEVS
ncbi:MAG: NFACT RNA binding domain-containing protein [Candidatus Krumholzibacteria bacterium]|nr:NFACT RNA binding domain-containing protein [Candidatus Krumholzibacteria bacterium]